MTGERPAPPVRGARRLATAGLAALLTLPLGAASGLAQGAAPQQRYVVRPGDSLDGVAATFGVDPAAILAASAISNPPNLTPAEVVVIPAPGQTPEEAAQMAAALEGSSPLVAGAHVVQPGQTLAGIAAGYGLSAQALADFNGLGEPDLLAVGQRLLIPPSDDGDAPPPEAEGEPRMPAELEVVDGEGALPDAVHVPGVPAYLQQHSLSCEYAAAFIATSAFGAGIPESVFVATVPPARNPHWGYRGNIDGAWGGTDDYGVYAEALVPTLNANGFAGDVFYSFGDPAPLRERIDAGLPVLTWLGFWGDTGITLEDDGVYTVAAGMHVVVVYGYDAGGVHVSNPGRGSHDYYGWDDFLAMWSVLDGMALAVAPY